jgi:NTE family protein
MSLHLAGGGSRGISQAGYIKAFSDMGFEPDFLYGSSVGCLNACLYLQGQLDKMEQLWLTVKNEDVFKVNYLMLPALPFGHNAAFNPAPLTKLIDKYVDFEKVKASKVDFYVGATNLTASKPEVYRVKDIKDEKFFKKLLLASASPPVLFPPVELREGEQFGDAGLCNNFNVSLGVKKGVDYIVVMSPTTAEINKTVNVLDMLNILTSVPEYAYLDKEISFIERLNEIQDYVPALRDIQCCVIKPEKPTGIPLLDFTYPGKDRKKLIQDGYNYAVSKLEDFKNR